MFKKVNKQKTLLLTLLLCLTFIEKSQSWWIAIKRCKDVQLCLWYAHMEWLIYHDYLPYFYKKTFAQILSIKYWGVIVRMRYMEVPWMWYYTIPVKSFKRLKPWSTWNHPQYAKYHGRVLEDEKEDMVQIKKEYTKLLDEKESKNVENMYICTSVEECINDACEGIKNDTEIYLNGHQTIAAFYQTALQLAYKRITGKLINVDYFYLKCMENVRKDGKIDNSNLELNDKLLYDTLEDEAVKDFAKDFNMVNIPGFMKIAVMDCEPSNGRNIEQEHSSSIKHVETNNPNVQVIIPPMADQVF